MNPEQIRYNREKLCKQITKAEEALGKLRMICKHKNIFEGNYCYRPGSISRAILCIDCGNLIKYL